MSQEIDALITAGLIEKTKADYIKEKFQDFAEAVEEWSKKANEIVVTEETQKELMTEAREGRLLLKAKRIEVEKVRKSTSYATFIREGTPVPFDVRRR